MTPFENFLQLLVKSWRLDIILLAKLGTLLLFLLFFAFSLVVTRQIHLMSETVTTQMDVFLKWAGRFLVLLAIGAFVLALIIL